MYFDAFTISALVDELTETIVGGRVQDAIDVDATGLGLEIYANRERHYLYMNADQQLPRVHLVQGKLRRGLTKPTQLGLAFRSYVEDALVTGISQPAWERILHIELTGPKGDVIIIIEPMERRSNVLLVQNGTIIDCIQRVGPEENSYRLSLPAHEYVPPPPLTGRHDPTTLTLDVLRGIFEQESDTKRKTQQVLSSRLLGVSPLLAKEIVHRGCAVVNQKANEADVAALYDALNELIAPLSQHEWQPGVVENDDGVVAFSVYPITHLVGWRPVDTVSAAAVAYYGQPTGEDAYKAAKIPVREQIRETIAKLSAKLDSLEASLVDDAELEYLRKSGELILAYQYMLEPGQAELRAQYDPDEPELVIALDTSLSPVENSQRYFDKYNRAKRALEGVPQLVEETRNELAFVEQLALDLEIASNWPEIDEVRQALQQKGHWRGKKAGRVGGGQSAPLRVVTKSGHQIWIGRNSRQNDIVTFKRSSGDDLWLHAHDVPGSHVIIKYDGREIPEDVILQAASLAAYYSAKRDEGSVLVDVTRCKYVKKIKGAGPGMVTYRNEETRTVAPMSEAELGLERR